MCVVRILVFVLVSYSIPQFCVSPVGQEKGSHFDVVFDHCIMQWRLVVVSRGVHKCSVAQQLLNYVIVTMVTCLMLVDMADGGGGGIGAQQNT